jgi:hypothetical protein
MTTLLRWFDNREVRTVVLQTTEDGAQLYSSLGFQPSGERLLVRQETPT